MIGECWPPKPPSLLLQSRLDSPLLINGALLRHDAPFMFIGCPGRLVILLPTSLRRRQLLSDSVTYGPPASVPRLHPPGAAVHRREESRRSREGSVSSGADGVRRGLLGPAASDAQRVPATWNRINKTNETNHAAHNSNLIHFILFVLKL